MGQEMKRKTIVIGHRNPDTDSICSAICYAHLKEKLTGQVYVPGRAGQVNRETKFVLDYFGMKEPLPVTDVRTQVKDIEIRKTKGVADNISLKKAWNIMQENNVVTIPSVREDGTLEGLITVGDITKTYMNIYDSSILSKANTQYSNILETLEADMMVGDPEAYFNQGKVLIAAANPDLMEYYIEPHDLVILGNRYESQLCAIEMDASCLVICQNSEVSKTIRKMAEEREIVVIVTPYDTFTAARLINQSIPVKYFMSRENLETFRLNDYVDEVKEVMAKKKYRDFPVLDKKGHFYGFISRRRLISSRKKQVILVDHNEKSQAVDGIEEAEILEIIDHHRLGSLETMGPVYFRNQPVGCTATIIYQMYQENGVEVDKTTAALLCSAILSDTLLFRSPTCTMVDKAAAEALARIAGLDMEEHAREMFRAGSSLGSKTPEEIFFQDFKVFSAGDTMFGVGQINAMGAEELEHVKEKLAGYLSEARVNQGMQMVFIMLTDILEESTELLCDGEGAREAVLEAFGLPEETERILLKGVVSRKKQLIPPLVNYLQQ